MKRILIFATFAGIMSAGCGRTLSEADYRVVPIPNEIAFTKGEGFELNKSTLICYPAGNERLAITAGLLSEYVELSTGLKLKVKEGKSRGNSIALATGFSNDNPEAYLMTVDSGGIVIDGASPAGTLFGVQTLRKSLPVAEDGTKFKGVRLPAALIADAPRFPYRGMHLDVARHMFPVEFVKRYIDLLALHNMNVFHWHLTDDQGWRIEIKAYPRLTEIGSSRPGTRIGNVRESEEAYDSIPVSGFFTQEQIRDVVAYAANRNIAVIPEVDLPGHMVAALAAYPEFGCTGGPYAVERTWGVFPDVLCVGRESTFEFLENIFTEVMELFPSKYIHIGGDECPKVRWEKCPECQARIKQLGLKSDKEHTAEQRLQSYTMQRIEKFLNDNGRSIIGWDEILEGGIAPNATIMSWRGTEGGIAAAEAGHDAIMTPKYFCYFDYWQGINREDEPLGQARHIPVDKIYSYEPFEDGLSQGAKDHIIGVQANLWAEYVKTPQHAEYMVLPRMDALSEVQWVPQGSKDYEDFLLRLVKMRDIYEKAGYNYAKHVFADK